MFALSQREHCKRRAEQPERRRHRYRGRFEQHADRGELFLDKWLFADRGIERGSRQQALELNIDECVDVPAGIVAEIDGRIRAPLGQRALHRQWPGAEPRIAAAGEEAAAGLRQARDCELPALPNACAAARPVRPPPAPGNLLVEQ